MDFKERMRRLNLTNAAVASLAGLGQDTIGKVLMDRRNYNRADTIQKIHLALLRVELPTLCSLLATYKAVPLYLEAKMLKLREQLMASASPDDDGGGSTVQLRGSATVIPLTDLDLFTSRLQDAATSGKATSFTASNGVTVLVPPAMYKRPIPDALAYLDQCLSGRLVVATDVPAPVKNTLNCPSCGRLLMATDVPVPIKITLNCSSCGHLVVASAVPAPARAVVQ